MRVYTSIPMGASVSYFKALRWAIILVIFVGWSADASYTGTGPLFVTAVPFVQTGAGSLSVSTSTAINGMTVTAGSLPTKWANLIVIDNGSGDIAVCVQGGTCTCAETSVASTNGITIKSGGASNQFNWAGIAPVAATPTIVSCGGSAQPVDFEF